jgi:hypothetical protein
MTAKQSSKVSRRRAITTIGAGLVGGTVVSAAGGQKKPVAPKRPASKPVSAHCGKVVSSIVTAKSGEKQLVASVCCDYTKKALNDCFKALRESDPVDAKMKTDLKDFLAELDKQALLDFCYIHFNIPAEKLNEFKQRINQVVNGI